MRLAFLALTILLFLSQTVNSFGEDAIAVLKSHDKPAQRVGFQEIIGVKNTQAESSSSSGLEIDETSPDRKIHPERHKFQSRREVLNSSDYLKDDSILKRQLIFTRVGTIGPNASKRISQSIIETSKKHSTSLESTSIGLYKQESDSPSMQMNKLLTKNSSLKDNIMGYDEVFERIDRKKISAIAKVKAPKNKNKIDRGKISELDRDQLIQKWSEPVVFSWQKEKLDLELMDVMSTYLNLKSKSCHVGVASFIRDNHYYYLRQLWRNPSKFRNEISRVESAIRRELDDFEFFRRINAFRILLHRHTISSNWRKLLKGQCIVPAFTTSIRFLFGFHFGLSVRPSLVENPACSLSKLDFLNLRSDSSLARIKTILEAVCGNHEGQRRLQFKLYLLNRLSDSKAAAYPKLFKESSQFGLTLLTILKVKDALQLRLSGSDVKPAKMTADESFAQVLDIMNDKEAKFPWTESPERAWLKKVYGRIYGAALTTLSKSISNSNSNDIPRSTAALKSILGRKIKIKNGYKIGYELLWCDFGLNPREILFMLRNSENPQDHDRFVRAIGRVSKGEKELLQDWHRYLDRGTNDLIASLKPSLQQKFSFLKTIFLSPYYTLLSSVQKLVRGRAQ